MSMVAHPIVHVDIPARDPEAAAKFYEQVFDWQIDTQWPSYPMFKAEGGPAGGFSQVSDEAGGDFQFKSGEVLIYLSTDDIDATLASIEANGGKTIQPRTEIPQVGFWAVFQDPAGNRIGLFNRTQPAS
jgi:predicted enzyme related to lactoylglutathione lyase